MMIDDRFYHRLPDDIWLVDLDANRISGPKSVERDSCDFIPSLPEPEASVLRNHLKQVTNRHPSYIFPSKAFISNKIHHTFIFYTVTFYFQSFTSEIYDVLPIYVCTKTKKSP
jgi:hypothetical protein